MAVMYLVLFIGGLLMAVGVMMFGVERPRQANPSGERSFRLSPPVILAFATVFGLVGYLMSRRPVASPAVVAAAAGALGLLSALVAARWVKQWWVVTPEHDVEDERYLLQGHVARVVKPIAAGADGEVTFEVDSEHHVVRAKSLDDAPVAAGTEVVIERIEGDVAYVEAWEQVEKRL